MRQRMAKLKPLRLPNRTNAAAADETKEQEAEKGDEEKENDVAALMRRAHRLRSEIDSSLMRSAEVSVDLKKKTCTDEAVGSLLERRMQQTRLADEAASLQEEV